MNELIVRDGDRAVLADYAISLIRAVEEESKAAKRREEEVKAAILEAMEKAGVTKLDNPKKGVTVTYFPPTVTKVFDQGAFVQEQYDLYEAYCTKERRSKSYIKIQVKEPKNAET